MTGKELELLKTAAPNATRIVILTNPSNPAHRKELQGAREAAAALGAEIVPVEIPAPGEIDNAFAAIKARVQMRWSCWPIHSSLPRQGRSPISR